MLKRLGSLLPVLPILLIPISLTKQILFYYNYNVPIKNFIGLSELGLLIADDILIVMPIFILIALFTVVFHEIKSLRDKKKQEAPNKPQLKRKTWFKVNYVFLLIGVICLIYLLTSPQFYFVKIAILINVAFLLLCVILFFLRKYYLAIFPSFLERLLFLCIFFTFLATTYQLNFEIVKIETGKYTGTHIRTANIDHTSSALSFYIGKTEKYVFIYNKKDSSTDIIPTDDIIEFKLKSK